MGELERLSPLKIRVDSKKLVKCPSPWEKFTAQIQFFGLAPQHFWL